MRRGGYRGATRIVTAAPIHAQCVAAEQPRHRHATVRTQPAETAAPIVIVGNGPAGVRVAQELTQRRCASSIVLYGAEPCEHYNRVRLSSFLAGEVDWNALTRDARLPACAKVQERLGCAIRSIDRSRGVKRSGSLPTRTAKLTGCSSPGATA